MRNADRAVAALALAFGAACGSSGGGPDDGGGDSASDATGGSSSGSGTDSDGSSGANGSSSGSGASSGGSGASSGGSGASSSSGGSGSSSGSQSDASAPSQFDVLQHHKNPSRNGVYVEPTFTKTTIATMHTTTIMGAVSKQVYAQPLYVEEGPGGVPVFIVATEENHVAAVNAATGATVWDTGPSVLGVPVPSGSLACGDISPVGITGTPIADMSSGSGVIYLDALTTVSGTVTHRAFALNLSDGKVVTNWPVDLGAKISGFTPRAQLERGALQLVGGTLFIPFGGNDGDCDTYKGYVVGIPVANPQSPIAWHSTATQSGIWGPGSLPSDGTSVFPVTGNTFQRSPTPWGQSETVLRLGTTLTFSGNAADYYYPSNWLTLDKGDVDLGGANDVLFDMPGTAHPHLLAQGGKDGHLYLLDRDNLGGMAGELLNAAVATSEIKGAPTVYSTGMGTYVAFHVEGGSGSSCPNGGTGNIVAVKITAGPPISAKVAWCSNKAALASPMVTTTDGTSNAVVWAANNALWGFDGDTGALLAGATSGTDNTSFAGTIQGWNLPIAAHGKMALGYYGELYIFTP